MLFVKKHLTSFPKPNLKSDWLIECCSRTNKTLFESVVLGEITASIVKWRKC